MKQSLAATRIGLDGIRELADQSECSLPACAIRAAECSPYPMAVVVSRDDRICYGFLSDGFKQLKPRAFPRKGDPLPFTSTRDFNSDLSNIECGRRVTSETTLAEWFDGPGSIRLDEEIVGLGTYGYTLTVFSSEELPDEPDEEDDEEQALQESYTPRFAYGR